MVTANDQRKEVFLASFSDKRLFLKLNSYFYIKVVPAKSAWLFLRINFLTNGAFLLNLNVHNNVIQTEIHTLLFCIYFEV
jgi:hypothetical protein